MSISWLFRKASGVVRGGKYLAMSQIVIYSIWLRCKRNGRVYSSVAIDNGKQIDGSLSAQRPGQFLLAYLSTEAFESVSLNDRKDDSVRSLSVPSLLAKISVLDKIDAMEEYKSENRHSAFVSCEHRWTPLMMASSDLSPSIAAYHRVQARFSRFNKWHGFIFFILWKDARTLHRKSTKERSRKGWSWRGAKTGGNGTTKNYHLFQSMCFLIFFHTFLIHWIPHFFDPVAEFVVQLMMNNSVRRVRQIDASQW